MAGRGRHPEAFQAASWPAEPPWAASRDIELHGRQYRSRYHKLDRIVTTKVATSRMPGSAILSGPERAVASRAGEPVDVKVK